MIFWTFWLSEHFFIDNYRKKFKQVQNLNIKIPHNTLKYKENNIVVRKKMLTSQ